MKTSGNIEKKVEAVLASIDHVQRATANPYLYTRIMASLNAEENNRWAGVLRLITKPVIALAATLLIIMMNSLIFFQPSDSAQIAVQDDDQLFAAEYNYSTTTTADGLYIVNEEQP